MAAALAPGVELGGDEWGGLAGKRWAARADPFAPRAVTARAGRQAARGVAAVIERRALAGRKTGAGEIGRRQAGIEAGDLGSRFAVQPQGDGAHRRVLASSARIIVDLAVEIAGIEPGEARRITAIALAGKAVASNAGVRRTAIAAAQSDEFSRRGKRVPARLVGHAPAKHDKRHQPGKTANCHRWGTDRGGAGSPI